MGITNGDNWFALMLALMYAFNLRRIVALRSYSQDETGIVHKNLMKVNILGCISRSHDIKVFTVVVGSSYTTKDYLF